MGPRKNAGDQIELAKLANERLNLELALAKTKRRAARDPMIADIVKWAVVIGVTVLPLAAIRPIVEALAGKTTQVLAGLSVSIVYAAATTVGWVITAVVSRDRKKTNLELRAQIDELRSRELTIRDDRQSKAEQAKEAGRE